MKTFLASLLALLAMAAMGPGTARSQEFVKVNEAAQEHIPAVPFVAIAYGFIWVAVLAYVLVLAGKMARARRDVDDLRRRLARTETDMPPRK